MKKPGPLWLLEGLVEHQGNPTTRGGIPVSPKQWSIASPTCRGTRHEDVPRLTLSRRGVLGTLALSALPGWNLLKVVSGESNQGEPWDDGSYWDDGTGWL
jgi:hypothetical protein